MDFYERVQKARNEKMADGIISSIPEYNAIVKSQEDPVSRAKAINAFCFSCMGGTINSLPDPGYRQAIRECTSPDCPLYSFRPYQIKTVKE